MHNPATNATMSVTSITIYENQARVLIRSNRQLPFFAERPGTLAPTQNLANPPRDNAHPAPNLPHTAPYAEPPSVAERKELNRIQFQLQFAIEKAGIRHYAAGLYRMPLHNNRAQVDYDVPPPHDKQTEPEVDLLRPGLPSLELETRDLLHFLTTPDPLYDQLRRIYVEARRRLHPIESNGFEYREQPQMQFSVQHYDLQHQQYHGDPNVEPTAGQTQAPIQPPHPVEHPGHVQPPHPVEPQSDIGDAPDERIRTLADVAAAPVGENTEQPKINGTFQTPSPPIEEEEL